MGRFLGERATRQRARAILAKTFEPGFGDHSRGLDAGLTTCLQDRGEAVPSGVISMGGFVFAE